jgi:hypothetical protein
MIFQLRLKTAWNHVAKKTIEAKDKTELEKTLKRYPFWEKNRNRTTILTKEI